MDILIYLFPLTVLISFIGIVALLWSIQTGQYDDLEDAEERLLKNDEKNNTMLSNKNDSPNQESPY